MGHVKKTSLPPESGLHAFVMKGDFLDCYTVKSTLPVRQAAEELVAFPWWARGLLAIRNALVGPFGLSTEGPEGVDTIGIFPVNTETEREIIAGFDDKHLNFRLAIFADAEKIYLATWVHPHNWFGWLYLGLVMPFHILIIRQALGKLRGR